MTSPGRHAPPTERRVRVWFGEHLIAEHVGNAVDAADYEAGMRRRFASLRVTNELIAAVPNVDLS
ncbi:hypothetical protein GCM10009745_69580 [Kribbella yunnanensis]|uniref:Uncharacterized protein n=1 Tax=Kribbella yunnanensis TaxID=190194 RepID=A0ABN2ITN3_9ACTN